MSFCHATPSVGLFHNTVGGILIRVNYARRKLKRTFNEPGHGQYLTYSCYHCWPLLTKDTTRTWVIEAIDIARRRHEMDVYAYVVMPEHVHLLVKPRREEYRIEKFLFDLKRPVSYRAKRFLQQTAQRQWRQRLTVKKGKRNVFRFWQAGGGFDRNISDETALWPVVQYIHANPVRRGLVDAPTDWIWSSARFWEGMNDVPLMMDELDV